MFLTDLISRGGPVLYILFLVTLIIFYIVFNKYLFVYYDKKPWLSSKLDEFVKLNPPSETNLVFVEKTFLSEYQREASSNIKLLTRSILISKVISLGISFFISS